MTQARPGKAFLASLLYFSLPEKTQQKIAVLLAPEDRKRLIDHRQGVPTKNQYIDILNALKDSILKKQLNRGSTFSYLYLLFHIVYLIFALYSENISSAGAALIYGIAGFLFFVRKSASYIKLRFYPFPFHLQYLIFTVMCYPVILLMLGYFSIGAKPYSGNIILLIQASLLAPLFEEIFFREVLFNTVKEFTSNDVFVIAVTALLFSFVHLNLDSLFAEFVVYFTAGVLLGTLRWISGSLVFPLVLHVALNSTLFYL